jgi:hypothetical protein
MSHPDMLTTVCAVTVKVNRIAPPHDEAPDVFWSNPTLTDEPSHAERNIEMLPGFTVWGLEKLAFVNDWAPAQPTRLEVPVSPGL